MKPRVFVSSIMEGFSEFRSAAREAINKNSGEPILVEDHPSISASPRNACLGGVGSCDFLVSIIGLRGGFITPSGKLVIEEEYDEAFRKRIPVLVFVQEGDRDEQAQKFVDKISDYVDGRFRKTFSHPDGLGKEIEESLKPLTKGWVDMKYDASVIDNKTEKPFQINNETSLRFVIMPIRKGEIVDAVDLDTNDFKRTIYDIAHKREIDLFSYEEAKIEPEVEVDHVVYMQDSQGYRRSGSKTVRLEISTDGLIIIDTNVTGREKEDDVMTSTLISAVIHADVLTLCLRKCFGFSSQFFENRDSYRRFDPLAYNVCLNGIGYRQLVDQYPRKSVSMRMSGDNEVKAFDKPRIISRNELANPKKEIEAVISMLKRRMKD